MNKEKLQKSLNNNTSLPLQYQPIIIILSSRNTYLSYSNFAISMGNIVSWKFAKRKETNLLDETGRHLG